MNKFTQTTIQQFPLPFILLLVILVPLTIFLVILVNNYLTPSFIVTKQGQTEQSVAPNMQQATQSSLSPQDNEAKTKIIALLPNKTETGVLYKSSNITIDYIPELDVFQVEVDSQNVKEAKNETTMWFTQHGVSQKGICSLPLTFYLDSQLNAQFRQEGIAFSPLPDGC